MRKKLIVLLFLPILVFALCTQVCATERPDPEKMCSITFLLDFDGEPIDGGKLTLYRVGQLNSDASGFDLVDSLSQSEVSLENLQDPALAQTLSELAIELKISPHTAPVSNGKAVFSDLMTGLYVVSQPEGDETAGYAAINPFLISLPQLQNDTYIYDLTASPKVPLVPSASEPTESETTTPTEPDDTPDLPQTGQLNWPIPLLTVLGLAIFGMGFVLFCGSKRRGI